MKNHMTRSRFALIELWHGLKPVLAIATLTIFIVWLTRRLGLPAEPDATTAISLLPGGLSDSLGPLLMLGMAVAIAAAAALAAMQARHRRDARSPREAQVLAEISGQLQQQILPMEQLSHAYPQLIARIARHFKRQDNRTQDWLLRPHPALSNQRPIDVLKLPDGEERVLHAFETGPNS